MQKANRITGLVMLVISLYLLFDSSRMPYLIDDVPGPGFWPTWVAVFMAILALLLLFGSIRGAPGKTATVFDRNFWRNTSIVIGGSTISLLLIEFLGMLVGIGLLVGTLSWLLGTKSLKTNLALSVFAPLLFWLIFERLLKVNLPHGIWL